MKNFKVKWLLLSVILSIASINQMWGGTKRIYLVPTAWNVDGAKFWVHSWHDADQDASDVAFQVLSDDADIYYADIPDTNNKYIFTRNKGGSTGPWNNEWNRNTFDNAGTNGSKNCCFIKGAGSDNAEMQTLTIETVYYTSSKTPVEVNVSRLNDNGTAKLWRLVTMTDTGKRYDGNKLYKGSFYVIFGGLYKLQFRENNEYGSMIIDSWTSSSTYNGKLYHSSAWRTYQYDHVIKSGSTVVWDLGNETPEDNPWTNIYMHRMHYVASAEHDSYTKLSNNQSYKTYGADTYCSAFLFRNRNDGTWPDYRQTTDITGDACDVDGITVFTYPKTVTVPKLDWQVTKNAKKATSGKKIYIDLTNGDTWTSSAYLKCGTGWFTRSIEATKVSGTDKLYCITIPNDTYYEKYVLTYAAGNNSSSEQSASGNYGYGYTGITNAAAHSGSHRTDYQPYNIAADSTIILSSSSGSSPKVWSISKIPGHSRRVTISEPSHGTITVEYTDESNTGQSFTSGHADVAQTCIITVSSSADEGYSPASLTIGGASHTSGNTYIVRGDVTIAAEFTEDKHAVTVAYKCGETSIADNGSVTDIGIATSKSTTAPTITGYTFANWSAMPSYVTTASSLTSATITINATNDGQTITANYTANPYTVTLGNQNATVDGEDEVTATYNEAMPSIASSLPKRVGYLFAGYYNEAGSVKYYNADGTSAHVWDIANSTTTLHAHWAEDVHYFIGGTEDHEAEWKEEGNWVGGVPSSGFEQVYILAPVALPDDESIQVGKMDIVTGGRNSNYKSGGEDCCGKVTIPATSGLVIVGALNKVEKGSALGAATTTTPDCLYLESSLSGNASLVVGEESENQATVEFATRAKSDGGLINQYLGIPFDSVSKLAYYGSYLQKYDQPTDSWASFTNESKMYSFTAYRIMRTETTNETYVMSGRLELPGITDHRQKVLTAASSSYAGDNMYANSWNAPISIPAMVEGVYPSETTPDFYNVTPTIYIFNAGSSTDAAYYGDSYDAKGTNAGQWLCLPVISVSRDQSNYLTVIPSQQAFLVQTSTGGTLTLDYKKHVYDPAVSGGVSSAPTRAPQRATDGDLEKMRLYLKGESGLGDRLMMYMREDFTAGFDDGWEGFKLPGSEFVPQLCAYSDAGEMSINAVNDAEGTVLGFYAGTEDSEYTFAFGYEGDNVWYLNDLEAQQSTLINAASSYNFSAVPGTVAERRFVISHTPIANTPTGIDNSEAVEGTQARKQMINGILYIIRGGQIYSTDGQIVK